MRICGDGSGKIRKVSMQLIIAGRTLTERWYGNENVSGLLSGPEQDKAIERFGSTT
jgi:hypothetical protein